MDLTAALTAYRFACEAENVSPKTWIWYRQKLTVFLSWCGHHTCPVHPTPLTAIDQVDAQRVREFTVSLKGATNRFGRPISSYTIHGYVQVIKGFLNWCADEELVAERVVRNIRMPHVDQKVIDTFSADQIRAMLDACDDLERRQPWLAERNRTILMVLFDTGIRANELCDLTLDRVYLDVDDPFIRVNGKGRKQREVPLGKRTRQQLHRYLHRVRPTSTDPHVFLTRIGEPLTHKGLDDLFKRLRDRLDLTGVRVSCHTARHTFACRFMEAGGNIYKLSRLLGHTSVAVTENYLKAFSSQAARQGVLSVLDGLGR